MKSLLREKCTTGIRRRITRTTPRRGVKALASAVKKGKLCLNVRGGAAEQQSNGDFFSPYGGVRRFRADHVTSSKDCKTTLSVFSIFYNSIIPSPRASGKAWGKSITLSLSPFLFLSHPYYLSVNNIMYENLRTWYILSFLYSHFLLFYDKICRQCSSWGIYHHYWFKKLLRYLISLKFCKLFFRYEFHSLIKNIFARCTRINEIFKKPALYSRLDRA